MSSTSYVTPFAVYYDFIVVKSNKPKAKSGWVWWACLENPKTSDQGHRHRSVAAEDRSEKYWCIGTRVELDVTKK